MQTKSERKTINNEGNAQAMQDRRCYQVMREMIDDQAHRVIAAVYLDKLALWIWGSLAM